jgi:hypothetical protein
MGGKPTSSNTPAPSPSPSPAGPAWAISVGDYADPVSLLADPTHVAEVGTHMGDKMIHQPSTVVFKNVLVLRDMDAERFMASMFGMASALDAKCGFCHEEDKSSDAKEAKKFARQMLLLTHDANAVLDGKPRITCWTCHRGNSKGEGVPDDFKDRLAKVAVPDSVKVAPEDAAKPASAVFKNIRVLGQLPAGKLPEVMRAMSASLGVGCDHCHAADKWESDEIRKKVFARKMMAITARANSMIDGKDDGAVTCWTCHHGEKDPAQKP